MRMRRAAAPACLALLFLLSGCRTVWLHPDASAEKYEKDSIRCKYNMNPRELDHILSDPNQPEPRIRSDWKRCMALIGWSSRTDSSGNPAWARE